MRQQEVNNHFDNNVQDVDWRRYDALCAMYPQNKPMFYYNQIDEPQNWDPNRSGVWFPRRLLLASVPSLHKGKDHKVVIQYLPTRGFPLPANFHLPNFNRLGFIGNLKYVVGYACLTCKQGQRLFGCCSHVTTMLAAAGMFAYDQGEFKTPYKKLHSIDGRNTRSLNRRLLRP